MRSRNFRKVTLVTALLIFSSSGFSAQYVDYFEESTVELFEKQGEKMISIGYRPVAEISKECLVEPAGKFAILREVKNHSELSCGSKNIWVSSMSYTPVVSVDVTCTKKFETPVSKQPVIVIAGTRGAGAEKNACK